MPVEMISEDVVRIALDKAEGFVFERFANAFYAALVGASFAPLGGVRDGGADARDVRVLQDEGRPDTFYQASVEADAENKIRATVKRLREFGREPKVLTYLTSRTVKYTDRVERALGDELDVIVQIRDANYVVAHINTDARTRQAFDQYLRHYTDFLRQVGASRLIPPSKHVKSPAVYVFLANEIERRGGNESLVDSVTDALALWALEGTDPENRRTAEEVLTRILDQVPSVSTLVEPRLQRRLEAMGRKNYAGGRAVKWHQNEGGFCLPFEVRERIESENIADEALRLRVLDSLDGRLRDAPPPDMNDAEIRAAAEVSLRALQLVFEREGLEFARFLEDGGSGEYPTVSEALKDAVVEAGHTGLRGSRIRDGAFLVLRGVLYDSRPEERDYLQRLSRTYALLFTLNTEPRLLEFFQEMTGEFRLYVGSDQIVMALSEHNLPTPDQMTRNTLKMALRLGAKLILAEPALEEVVGHLRGADNEYVNHIQKVEHRLDYQLAREAPKIMVRAYLYARLAEGPGMRRRPVSWEAFVGQFLSHRTLHKPDAYDDMRGYLQTAFGFVYESAQQLEELVDVPQVEALAEQLGAHKSPRLAHNDALIALAVYGLRKRRRETSMVTEFGWGTWWLTGETSILRYTRDVVRENRARYIMRPDFLLNFLTFAPSAHEARQAFATIFPSLLGIQLAKRMQPEAFNEIMSKVAEAEQLDDARRTVEMGKLTNKLKSDFNHGYPRTAGRARAAIDVVGERIAEPL
jgi:hypothetical protein